MSQPYKAALAELCEEMAGVRNSDVLVRTADDARNEDDVQAVINTISSMVNPFVEEEQLISITSGAVATPEASADLATAHNQGSEQYKAFIKERLIDRTVDVFAPIPRTTLQDFTAKPPTNRMKAKATSAAQDRALFSRLLIASQSRSIDLKEILCYSLSLQPPALSTTDGSLTKCAKSQLLLELEILTKKPIVDITQTGKLAIMIDSMALIQSLSMKNPTLNTFAELADRIWQRILSIASQHGATRVDFVADDYRQMSIKDVERVRRSKSGVQRIRIGQSTQKLPKQWKKFLGHADNKNELLKFLFQEFSESRQLESLEVYVTAGALCRRVATRVPERTFEDVPALYSTHEEADTRLLLHTRHADCAGFNTIFIVSPDTDVVIIGLGVIHHITSRVGFVTGTGAKTRTIDMTKMAELLGPVLCKCLPYLHALTGCDSVSSFSGKSKKKALSIISKAKDDLKEGFSDADFEPSEVRVDTTQKFVCQLYGAKACTVNAARYELFKTGAGEQNLPPNDDCLLQHIRRATYQAAVWHRAIEPKPDVPTPHGYGWSVKDDLLSLTWRTKSLAPKETLKVIPFSISDLLYYK